MVHHNIEDAMHGGCQKDLVPVFMVILLSALVFPTELEWTGHWNACDSREHHVVLIF